MAFITSFLFSCFFWNFRPNHNLDIESKSATMMCNRMADSLVLVDVYNQLDGPNWFAKWNLNTPITSWYGITFQSGCVTKINLANNNLKGTLPNSISNLSNLTVINFIGNKIEGLLPISYANLSLLEDFILDANQIIGGIPSNYSNLKKLKFLSLSNNLMSGAFPTVLSDMTGLVQLNLANNAFNGNLPSNFGNLSKLEILDISGNKLTGTLPLNFALLSELRELFIQNNNFSGILPSNLSILRNLRNVWMHNNDFEGNFPDIRSSPLNSLKIDNNRFANIPDFSTINTWDNSDPFGLTITNNNFTFEDLIPLQKIPRNINYKFSPQRSVLIPEIIFVDKGTNYTLNLNIDNGITDNNYKWFKDTALVFISNENTYRLFNISENDEGNYSGRVTNVAIPGFEIQISSARIVYLEPERCNNPPAGESCEQSLEFCSTSTLHNYCGFIPIPDTSIQQEYFCDTVEKLDNPKFLTFQAPADSIAIEIIPFNCDPVTINGVEYAGLQASVFQKCGNEKEILICQSECKSSSFILSSKNYVIGEKYNLVLDGCHGSTCQYVIKITAGKKSFALIEPDEIVGDQAFCPDSLEHQFSIAKIPGAIAYLWYLNDSLHKITTDNEIALKNLKSGIYQIKVRGINSCDSTEFSNKIFQVFPAMQLSSPSISKFNKDSSFIIKFDVQGGNAPYVLSNGKGSLDSIDGAFLSDTLLCRSAYDFIIEDKFGCTIQYTGFENCGCNSFGGNFIKDTLKFCEGQNILLNAPADALKDSGDISSFILFSDPINFKGSVLRSSKSGAFSFDPVTMRLNTYYYIVYAISRPSSNGQVNLNHPCLSISSAQVVIFRAKPLVSAGADRNFCGLDGFLNGFGNAKAFKWTLVSGPGKAQIENENAAQSNVVVDSLGLYVFSLDGANDYCSSKDEVKLNFKGNIKPVISSYDYYCQGQKLKLDAGSNYINYRWSTGDSIRVIEVNAAGNYCVTVTDADACTGIICKNILPAFPPEPFILGNAIFCEGKKSILRLDQSYLNYDWNTGYKKDSLTIDTAGRYCVTVTATTGCSATACITTSILKKSIHVINDSTPCYGDRFRFGNTDFTSPGKFSFNSGKNNYLGCDSIIELNLKSPAKISIKDTVIQKDNGSKNGFILVNFQGGNPPYSYKWKNGETSKNLNNVMAGNYWVRVEDRSACFDTFYFEVKLNTASSDLIKDNSFIIYPNPIQEDNLQLISLEASGKWQYDLYDINGKLKQSGSINIVKNEMIDISVVLTNGLYFINLRREDGIHQLMKFNKIN